MSEQLPPPVAEGVQALARAHGHSHQTSRIGEAVAMWSNLREILRGGRDGMVVPVVIPKDRRRLGWAALLALSLYLFAVAAGGGGGLVLALAVLALLGSGLWLWRGAIVEIEQGTTGIKTRFGEIVDTLEPGRTYMWSPWDEVAFVVDTSTEIAYNAPVVACPTQENVPLKAIEFFLKFQITDPVAFVRTIGASNFDMVLSSAVQDAIRQRSRGVTTERAYDLRGSDVGDMQELLNRQLDRYGVRIIGSNIPDVQLPDQYHQHLSTRERIAKELSAYEREWELTRKRRIDQLLMDIERAKKERDARVIEVKEAVYRARQDVARMLEEQETEALRVRLEIEARGRATLTAAENEAKALDRLGQTYRDNRALLHYELARKRLEVGKNLAAAAPRPVVVHGAADGEPSALATLVMAQLLPGLGSNGAPRRRRARPDATEGSAPSEAGGDDRGGRLGELGDVVSQARERFGDLLGQDDADR